MVQDAFVNSGTLQKLEKVFKYADFYTSLLRNKPSSSAPFRLHYLDVFAGTGEVPIGRDAPLMADINDVDDVVAGSARRALEIRYPFSRYVFSDKKRSHVRELSALRAEYPSLANRIEVIEGDANEVVTDFCRSLGAGDRALVFLDPFGNQVHWETLEILAGTRKVDLWYLFPAWIGIARQIKNSGEILKDAEASIDAMFGPHDWRTRCVQEVEIGQGDFFSDGGTEQIKIAKADDITRFMIECMGGIFGGGVSQKWLPLGRNGRHFYSLLFACANPSGKANIVAQKVAREIMTRK